MFYITHTHYVCEIHVTHLSQSDLPLFVCLPQVQVHIVGAVGELTKLPMGQRELLRCHGCRILVDLLKIPNQQLVATAAMAIATCAVDPECRRYSYANTFSMHCIICGREDGFLSYKGCLVKYVPKIIHTFTDFYLDLIQVFIYP